MVEIEMQESKRSYVYFLRHAEEQRFKIGKANNPFQRSRALTSDHFDLEVSLCIRVVHHRVFRLEDALQTLLHRFAVDPGHGGPGKTEWFSMDAWPRLMVFFEQNADLLGASPERITVADTKPIVRVPLRGEARAARIREKREQRRQEESDENLQAIGLLEPFAAWISDQTPLRAEYWSEQNITAYFDCDDHRF